MSPIFPIILTIHSILRWGVVTLFILSLFRWFARRKLTDELTQIDRRLINVFVIIFILQIILGAELYVNSPLVNYFVNHFEAAMHERQIRFFGMEHGSMMIVAFLFILIGVYQSKKKLTKPYKYLFRWYLFAFILLFFSIPWEFSPLTSRPLWRWF
ncbi:MAG: hypothetical protein HYR91_01520 [Flavobacteriia bacterium]|nr:hypothetical protein [Flavobacteriia bacterium]